MEKTILTLSDIRAEIKKQYEENFTVLLLTSIITVPCTVIMTIFTFFFPEAWFILICVVFCFFSIGLAVITVINYFKTIRAIKKGKIYVDIDKIEKRDKLYEFIWGVPRTVLFFEKYGEVFLSEAGKYYTYNPNLTMNHIDIYESSNPGDTFYIVSTDHKNVLVFFNSRFFEYKEPGIKDLF